MILTQEKALQKIDEITNSIFVYPRDTVYGIGCDANDKKKVNEIRKIKGRDIKPFSIIAPSKNWILNNFETTEEKINKYLPGKYTLILKKKNPDFMKYVSENEYLGIRIPEHKFTKRLQKSEKPIITTSVNFSGQKPATKISEIPKEIKENVDFIIDSGELPGKSSTLIKEGKALDSK